MGRGESLAGPVNGRSLGPSGEDRGNRGGRAGFTGRAGRVQSLSTMQPQNPRIRVSGPPGAPGADKLHALKKGVTRIGRNPDNQISLQDSLVSRFHAQIRYDGSMAVIEDVGGKNPVRVNGEEVHERPLAHGDRIVLGGTELVYECPAPPALKVIKDGGSLEVGQLGIVLDTATVTFERRSLV